MAGREAACRHETERLVLGYGLIAALKLIESQGIPRMSISSSSASPTASGAWPVATAASRVNLVTLVSWNNLSKYRRGNENWVEEWPKKAASTRRQVPDPHPVHLAGANRCVVAYRVCLHIILGILSYSGEAHSLPKASARVYSSFKLRPKR